MNRRGDLAPTIRSLSLCSLLTSPGSTRCSKVTMPLLLLSLSLSRSSSDSTAEDPVEEIEELDSFLRSVPSTARSQSSCCISREQPPPSGVMVTCGTRGASITIGGPDDGAIWAAVSMSSSQICEDLAATLRSKRDASFIPLTENPKSLELFLLHSLGIGELNSSWERTTTGAKTRHSNLQIWSFHFEKSSNATETKRSAYPLGALQLSVAVCCPSLNAFKKKKKKPEPGSLLCTLRRL